MSGTCSKCSEDCVSKESKTETFGFACDICKVLWCKKCANFSATDIRALVQTSKRILPFVCGECWSSFKGTFMLKGEMKRLQEEISEINKTNEESSTKDALKEINSEIKEIKKNLNQTKTQVETEINEIKESLNKTKTTYANVVKIQTEAETIKNNFVELEKKVKKINAQEEKNSVLPTIDEINERERRASNVIIFGAPETNEANIEERRAKEKQQIKDVLSRIDDSISVADIDFFRLGKFDLNKKRPIKIKFESREDALKVLKQRSKLDASQGIYIKGDLTVMQQEYLKEVVAELKSRIDNGETNLKIRYFNSVPKNC